MKNLINDVDNLMDEEPIVKKISKKKNFKDNVRPVKKSKSSHYVNKRYLEEMD